MRRLLIPALAVALGLLGCAGTPRGFGPPGAPAPWPYSGINEVAGSALGAYRGRFFSGTRMQFQPDGKRLFAESAAGGFMTIVPVEPPGALELYDFGHGSVIENLLFDPEGTDLYVMASTVRPENVGEVQLARALLRINTEFPLLDVPLALRVGGYSHGMALLKRSGLLFTLDTRGAGVSNGATLSRIDLYADGPPLRRPVGSLPPGLDRRGLTFDAREEILYALVATGGGGSDFDPPDARREPEETYLAGFEPDSLGLVRRFPLARDLDWVALARSPRGVMVLGRSPGRARLVEIDTALMQEVGWVELPAETHDLAVGGDGARGPARAVLPGRYGLYIIDLDLFTARPGIPLETPAVGEAALSPDGRLAAVMLEDVEFPGQPAVALIDLDAGRLLRIIR